VGTRTLVEQAIDLLESALKTYDGPANIAGLKLRMLELDSAFDERSIGYHNFLDFLRATCVVSLASEGSTWYACLSEDVSVPASIGPISSESDKSEFQEVVELTELYRQALRKKKWRAISGESLLKIYQAIGDLEALPRSEIAENIVERIGSETTLTEVRKALALLHKSGLLEYIGSSEEGDSLWRVVKDVSKEELFRAVDTAMAVRLLSACVELSIPLASEHLTELVLGPSETKYLSAVMKLAKEIHRDFG
jgi:hypothetical protein